MTTEGSPTSGSDQKMEVLGHDDVSVDHEAVFLAGLFKDVQEQVSADCGVQDRAALVTAAGDEVEVLGVVVPVEVGCHGNEDICGLSSGM